jgi:radical SAM protein with 4Fe4S-binding SPASM domain
MIMPKVSEYVDYITRKPIPELLDQSGVDAIRHTADIYGSLEATQCIAEIILSSPQKHCDFSLCVEKKECGIQEECWYELDYECCIQREITPCFFFNAETLLPGSDCSKFLEVKLRDFYSGTEIKELEPFFSSCLNNLEGITKGLYQLGIMSSRAKALQEVSVRIFTLDMRKEGATKYLQKMGWGGDLEAFGNCLSLIEPYAHSGLFNIDFDISRNGMSKKVGINFYVRKDVESQEDLLDYLVRENLCLPEKREGILKWITRLPQNDPFISNDWCHVKFPFEDGCTNMAKAYLRSSHLFYEKSEIFERPSQMNLELTDRCPLNCPQCYCDLQNAHDMPLETAIRSIREAGAAGVASVYLSGGETLLYPHLMEVVREASRDFRDINIAISGLGLDQKVFEELVDAGVTGIYISLNGSTKEVNEHTRKGFELAIRALSLLKGNRFPNTHINWVMHSNNADDFNNMVALAEAYDVKRLVIMQFKPDSRNELNSLPTYAQMIKVRDFTWNYQELQKEGNNHNIVDITVESCYSPMKALLEQRFLGNQNRGVYKGCLAGRAVYSVALDGRLTPCRHLHGPEWSTTGIQGTRQICGSNPYVEEYTSIEDYWQKSEILKRLRQDNDNRTKPCADCRFSRFCRPCVAMKKAMKDTRRCAVYEALSDGQTY